MTFRRSLRQPRLSLSVEKGLEQKAEPAAIAWNWLAAPFWPAMLQYAMHQQAQKQRSGDVIRDGLVSGEPGSRQRREPAASLAPLREQPRVQSALVRAASSSLSLDVLQRRRIHDSWR